VPKTVEWFRSMGYTITPTRHRYVHVAFARNYGAFILTTDDLGDTDVHGPLYRSKAEALAVVPQVAASWTGVDPAPVELPSKSAVG
jgi:hypothetical protein